MGGIGGSGNAPATFSILADYFPAAKLPKALAVMNIGFYYGAALALLLGGALLGVISTLNVVLPIVGALRPWQAMLLLMAIPDLLLGILALTTLHEPKRRGSRIKAAANAPRVVPVRDVAKFLYDGRAAFGPMFLGLCCNSLAMGATFWNAPFFSRTYGWSPAQYGAIQGMVLLVLAPIGSLAGGFLAEWFAKKGRDDANLRVVFIGTALHVPFAMDRRRTNAGRFKLLRQAIGAVLGTRKHQYLVPSAIVDEMREQVPLVILGNAVYVLLHPIGRRVAWRDFDRHWVAQNARGE